MVAALGDWCPHPVALGLMLALALGLMLALGLGLMLSLSLSLSLSPPLTPSQDLAPPTTVPRELRACAPRGMGSRSLAGKAAAAVLHRSRSPWRHRSRRA